MYAGDSHSVKKAKIIPKNNAKGFTSSKDHRKGFKN